MKDIKLNNKFFFKENLKKSNKIIFFTGDIRAYYSISKYVKKIIKDNDLNVVLSIWNKKNVNYKKLLQDIKPLYLDIEEFKIKKTYQIFGKKCIIDKLFGSSAISTRAQIYKIDRSISLIEKIEKKISIKFSTIIKSRLDFLILSKFNFKSEKNTIFFENTIGNWAIDRSDRFFYADRKTIKNFKKNIKKFCYHKWQKQKEHPIIHRMPIQEMLIKMYCDEYKINTKPIFPVSKIWRKKSEPSINDIFRMYLFVLKRLIKRKLMRFKT